MYRQIYRGICNKIFRAGLVKVRSRKSTENGIYAESSCFLSKKSMYGAKKQAQNMDSNIQSKPLFFAHYSRKMHQRPKRRTKERKCSHHENRHGARNSAAGDAWIWEAIWNFILVKTATHRYNFRIAFRQYDCWHRHIGTRLYLRRD